MNHYFVLLLNYAKRRSIKHLTQQNDEKHIPIYNQGTRTPEISALSNASTEPGSRGKLFKFQPDFTYGSSESDPCLIDEALGNPLPKTPVSKSAP